jgi:alkanesulfonate monooxygenase SsuD/methylene tetrahydromethanopterin reductase-like flavin-dependent oxidoreductase (luciferase family)
VPTAHCAETTPIARDEVRERTTAWIELVLDSLYKPLKTQKDYEYFGEMERVENHRHDLDALAQFGPTIMAGDPDYFIEAIKKLEERGVDEVVLALDGISHAHNVKAIELLGKHVLPEFHREPETVAGA